MILSTELPVTDDQVADYERLFADVNPQTALAYASTALAAAGRPATDTVHLVAVGELAARYADRFYTEADALERRYRRKLCQAAGHMHEVLAAGVRFEDLIGKFDEALVMTVAAATPDYRLPPPTRAKSFQNQVGRSSAEVQLVVLADLRIQCLDIEERRLPPDNLELREWLGCARDLLPAFHRMAASPLAQQLGKIKSFVTPARGASRHVGPPPVRPPVERLPVRPGDGRLHPV
jgi:hypothetical protein